MKKPYRNALRSKNMIRQAFCELMQEKTLEQITVVDIVNRSDLSRNTFYAHYQDVYAVLEEYQNEELELARQLLDAAAEAREIENLLPLLQKVAGHVESRRDIYLLLMRAGQTGNFLGRIKALLTDHLTANFDTAGIRDPQGFLIFIDVLSTGFFHLFELYLCDQLPLTPQQIVGETNRIFCACISLYR